MKEAPRLTRLDEIRDLLARLIAFPTVSSDSNSAMIGHLADRLDDAGAAVEVMADPGGTKANLFATIGPDAEGGIMLSGHSDVVPVEDQPWTCDPFRLTERDGRWYGRGSCDMKGFIAAAVAMAPEFAESVRRRPLHFAITYDEEVGCIGAAHLARDLATRTIRPANAIVGEPTEMRLVEGHKGCHEYTTRFSGLAGHGAKPDQGVNAVEFAALYVGRLLELKDALRHAAPDDSPFAPPWTTINVRTRHGGVARNVIAPSARVEWEMRPVRKADGDYVRANLRDYCDRVLLPRMRAVCPQARIETEVIGEVDGLVPADENEARRIVAELTCADSAELVPFGTEAGIFQALGMDVVICGPGSIDQAHKADEFVSVEQMLRCIDMLDGLRMRLAT